MASAALLVLLLAAAASARLEELSSVSQQAQRSVSKAPFKACIDDSDCQEKGAGYACFQYICYPWADDTGIAARDKKATCKSNDDCSNQLTCFRHHDRRQIHRGLCMEPVTDCSENGRDDCKAVSKGAQRECCNGQFCCGKEYFNQLKNLSCVNDLGCKDLGYGNFCCPPTGNSTEPSTCCNVDPNPTTTQKPTTRSPSARTVKGSSSSVYSSCLSALLLAPLLILSRN